MRLPGEPPPTPAWSNASEVPLPRRVRALHRQRDVIFVLWFLALVAVPGWRMATGMHPILSEGALWAMLPAMLAGVGAGVWWRRRMNAMLARAHAMNWRCCDRCLYDLRAAGNEGVCPECGTRFSTDGLALRWNAADRAERPHRPSA